MTNNKIRTISKYQYLNSIHRKFRLFGTALCSLPSAFFLLLTAYCLLPTAFCRASAKGTSGVNFLKFGVGARPLGMGGAFVAVADDVNSIWWNPAGIAALKTKEITFMHNEAGEDIRYEFLAYSQPVRKFRGSLGGSISYLSVSDIQGYTAGGVPSGKLSASALGVNLTYGLNILKSVSLGSNFKFIQEKLDTKKATTYGLDIGGLWESPLSGLRFGFNVQNIGKGIKFVKETSPLPLNYKLGGAFGFRFFGNKLIIALDINLPTDHDTFYNAGTECTIYDLVTLRAGYKSKDDLANGLRLGGGIKGKNLMLDYAWLPRGDFEDSHRMAVTLRFGRRYRESEIERNIREHFEKGKKYFYNGRMLKAYREFKDILLVAPRHKDAQDFLGKIELNIESAEVAKEIDKSFNQGEKHYNTGDLTAACTMFERILALNPDHLKAANYIKKIDSRFKEVVNSILAEGITMYRKADYNTALLEMEKVLTLEPDNEEASKYIGLIEKKLEELEKIKAALKKEQEERIKKRKITSYLKKATAQFKKKKWDYAIRNYKRVLKLDPGHPEAIRDIAVSCYMEGLSLENNGNLLKSMDYLNNALKFNPAYKEADQKISAVKAKLKKKAKQFNKSALMEYTKGNLKKAIAYWKEAIEYDNDFAAAIENLNRAKKEIKK